jgi:hypothetical protein
VTSEEELGAHLSSVLDELVDLIAEAKQAAWTAPSTRRRALFDDLKSFLAEQAALIDEAGVRLGTGAPSITTPTGHRSRNLSAEAGGDLERLVELLARDLRGVVDDVRSRAATVEGEGRQLLSTLADDLERHVDTF